MNKISKLLQLNKILLKCVFFLITIPTLAIAADPSAGSDDDLSFESDHYNFSQRNKVDSDLSTLDTTLAGEQIDPYSGALSFRITDVSLPGNSKLPVEFTRVISHGLEGQKQLADWDMDIPRIEGRYGYNRGAPNCQKPIPDTFVNGKFQTGFYPWDYHHGLQIHSSAGGGKLLTPTSWDPSPYELPAGYKHLTKSNWILKCSGATGEDFIAHSPQGLKYTFNVITKQEVHPTMKGYAISRTQVVAKLVSKIEDRFGNYVNYQYSDGQLTAIEANDGRKIEIDYYTSGDFLGKISRVTADSKTWIYNYQTSSSGAYLAKVTLPDYTFWLYKTENFRSFYLDGKLDGQHGQPELTVNITHPQGSVVNITLRSLWRYKPGRCWNPAQGLLVNGYGLPNINHLCRNRILSVVNKNLIVNNGDVYSWRYEYSDNDANVTLYNYSTNTWVANIDKQINTVITPTAKQKYTFSRRKNWQEGALLKLETFSLGDALISSTSTQWQIIIDYGEGDEWDPSNASNIGLQSFKRAEISRVVTVENNSYSTVYDDYNDYGALLQSHSYNSFSANERHVKRTYQHDSNNWLLNLPRLKSISSNGVNWTTHQENTYHSATGSYKSSPYETKIMGRVATRNGQYHSDGNLKKVEYVGTGRYELFEDYKRGKARKVTLPCHQTIACNTANGSTTNTVIAKLVVNNDGTIDKKTDFNGNSTNYDYNSMGWLTKIDPVDSKWSNTTISYGVVATANDGLIGSGAKVGQLKQTISQGNYQKLTYFDSMLRPYLVRTRDTSNTATTTYQRNEYDAENRVTFTSFPSSYITASSGVRSVYDELSRKKSDTRTTDNASTRYNYLSNNRVSVTDAKNNTITTTFLAYGSPSQSKATYIDSPEGVDTSIGYNLFGQIKSVTQGGITENRLYDNYQQLCKTVRPDTGVTAFSYNSARQLVWQAEGASGSTSACDSGQVPASQKTNFSYNNWGSISLENYPDGSPDKVYGYDENGQLETLTAGISVWTYDYNSLGMVEKQTLAIDNKSFVIDPEYSSLGHLKSLAYPSGRVVEFLPNALGQATKAGTYALNAKYYANGSLDSFTFGNGLTYKRTLNSEQQPYELTVKQGSNYKSRQRYLYDDNNNVDYVYDLTDRSYDIDLGYDDLDRLEVASGKWGSGSFSYDDLGNLLTKKLGSQSLTYHYDTSKNRLSSVTGAASYNFQYDTLGNVRNNGRYGLIFNRANQLTNAKGNAYVYDGHNRLVKKVSGGTNVYSVYGMSGTLYYLEDSQQKKTDYIRIGSELVAKDDSYFAPNTEPTTPPNAVNSLSGHVSSCYLVCNFVTNWYHSQPNAITYYQLFKLNPSGGLCPPKTICSYNNSTSFTSWTKVYDGNANTFTVTSSEDYVDFKVRACNALGCSDFSSIKRVYSTISEM